MNTAKMKQQLHNYIDNAEEKKLKAIYTLLENEMETEYKLSKEQMDELDRRYSDHINGIEKSYTWEEVVELTDKALAGKSK